MYALCGSFIDSCKVFYNLDLFCSVPWNWMIRGLARIGWLNFALLFYFKMLGYGVSPDKYTFPCVVKACVGLNDKKASKFIEETVLSMGHEVDAFVASSLIKLQSESGRIDEARKLFDRIPHRDCVLWNTMLNGYLKCGGSVDVIAAFAEMRRTQTKPNSVTFACVLSVCASESLMQLGTQLHGLIVASGLDLDPAVSNTLLAMYSKCAELSNAHKLFQMMPQTDLVSWNCIISGFVQNGCMKEGLNLFRRMIHSSVSPDSITLSSLLPALVESGSLKQCREIHGYVLRHAVLLDIFLKSALIDAYFKCRDVVTARTIFNQCTGVDVVVGTAMISGYVLNGMNFDALETFRWLLAEAMSPNDITLASVLPACANLVALKLGKELHANILKRGLKGRCHVECALMDMYGKCGKLDLAHQIFGKMSIKDTVSWNSMITSYAQNGKPNEAIDIFREMGLSGSKYDCVSVSAVLSACANLPSQHHGKEIHCFMIKEAGSSDVLAESALIDMYAKCGNLEYARRAFERMEEKNEVSWNSIIAAYGNHGCLSKALNFFHEMLENGIRPDHVTFLAIISACGHVGAVNDGIQYFRCMSQDYGITARMEHYACLVDLFGRSGHLKEAFETIKNMPFPPDAGVWGTLLGACRVHGNIKLAKVAANNLMSLDSQNSGYYILLSNIHANDRQWGSVLKVRSLMKERGLQKTPGYSWIELKNATHVFVATDGSHPDSEKIYFLLKLLLEELKREGYIPRPYLPMRKCIRRR